MMQRDRKVRTQNTMNRSTTTRMDGDGGGDVHQGVRDTDTHGDAEKDVGAGKKGYRRQVTNEQAWVRGRRGDFGHGVCQKRGGCSGSTRHLIGLQVVVGMSSRTSSQSCSLGLEGGPGLAQGTSSWTRGWTRSIDGEFGGHVARS